MRIKILILGLIFLIAFACTVNCDKDMAKIRAQHGAPEEINRYDTSDYHSVDWWYWSKGFCYTFTWGSIIEEGCKTSRYTFTPISKDYPKEIKDTIRENKKWD